MQKLDEYQAFVSIVDSGSLAAAAKALHLSPSAVSKKLGVLEAGLGVQLVDRSTRSLSITDAGRAFYADCKTILHCATDAEQRLRDSTGAPSGKLRLSCSRALLQPAFLRVINEFRRVYPNIHIDILVSDNIEDLIERHIDFAFRIGALKDSRLQVLPLMNTQAVFCAAPSYLDAHGRPEKVHDLRNHHVILPTYLNLSDKLRVLFTDPNASLDLSRFDTADDPQAIHLRIREGGGISMLLDLVVGEDIHNGMLEHVLPKLHFPKQPLSLLWHPQERPTQKRVLFKDYIRKHLIQAWWQVAQTAKAK